MPIAARQAHQKGDMELALKILREEIAAIKGVGPARRDSIVSRGLGRGDVSLNIFMYRHSASIVIHNPDHFYNTQLKQGQQDNVARILGLHSKARWSRESLRNLRSQLIAWRDEEDMR